MMIGSHRKGCYNRLQHGLVQYLNVWRICNMSNKSKSLYRRKALFFGGIIGAVFGVIIGSIAGVSFEAAITGFVGGWIIGEMITYGGTTPVHHHDQDQKKKHS
jgi:membrane associated rhomboid family serine protease